MSQIIPSFVRFWAKQLGAKTTDISRLTGGINNLVFSCTVKDRRFVIKGFSPVTGDERDRFTAEMEFLKYGGLVASGFVPSLLYADRDHQALVMDYIYGDCYEAKNRISRDELGAAVKFFSLLNSDLDIARAFIRMGASEGYLRLTDHLSNIELRLSEMRASHLPTYLMPAARDTIRLLKSELHSVTGLTDRALALDMCQDGIDTEHICVSPSDFGFHNALRTPQGVKFFDFEFAGWDDPAKAIVDFGLQPQVPVEFSEDHFLQSLKKSSRKVISRRLKALKPILQLKWSCIIVGFLSPERFEKMRSVNENKFGSHDFYKKLLYKLESISYPK